MRDAGGFPRVGTKKVQKGSQKTLYDEQLAGRVSAVNNYKRRMAAEHKNMCAICGWSAGPPCDINTGTDVHHVIPVARGGGNEDENLIILCPNCHRIAHHVQGVKSWDATRKLCEKLRIKFSSDYEYKPIGKDELVKEIVEINKRINMEIKNNRADDEEEAAA